MGRNASTNRRTRKNFQRRLHVLFSPVVCSLPGRVSDFEDHHQRIFTGIVIVIRARVFQSKSSHGIECAGRLIGRANLKIKLLRPGFLKLLDHPFKERTPNPFPPV